MSLLALGADWPTYGWMLHIFLGTGGAVAPAEIYLKLGEKEGLKGWMLHCPGSYATKHTNTT
jgi:hypothetical protein